MFNKTIGDADHEEAGGEVQASAFLGNGGTEAASEDMVFDSDEVTTGCSKCGERGGIERPHGACIDDGGADATVCEELGGTVGVEDHMAEGDNGTVRALQEDVPLGGGFWAEGWHAIGNECVRYDTAGVPECAGGVLLKSET